MKKITGKTTKFYNVDLTLEDETEKIFKENNISEAEQINGLLTAGIVGLLVSNKVQLAGAVAGCQAECGVASAMAAGALTQMLGGNVDEIINASALALKNILGLTCDPVCGLVEVPCIKRKMHLPPPAVHDIGYHIRLHT